jgi:hypothetical protein
MEYIYPDEFLGSLFQLNHHFRRNSHGTHSKWAYDKIFDAMLFSQCQVLISLNREW